MEARCLLASDLFSGAAIEGSGFPNDEGETELIVGFIPEIGTAPDLPAEEPGVGESAALPPLDQTFFLHSRPSATKVIYLDFDGHTTSGTSWNTNYTSGADFTTPAYSFQGDSNSFTNTELQRIQYIWERVAEDFIPFDVDVTTEDPGVNALRKSGIGDTQWGIRVVIGGSASDWYGSAGGVAYLNSFDWSSDTPCFVFENNLSNGSEKSTAEAISHEAGHTLHLSHDGTSSVTYYRGHGSGATGWAPIMGVGYDRQLTQWSKGEYPDANQTQDDLSRITTQNGFGYRPDDHGGSIGAATPLSLSGTVVFNEGIIERNTDLDYFSFSTLGGTINLDIDPFYRSPNLDILATLYNSAGSIIATSNPVSALDANFSMILGPGTYYVSIDGTGKPANGSDYGYSDYASLGYYSITGTIVNTASPGIELYGTSFAADPISLLVAGGFVDASFSIENNGSTTAPAFDVKYYLSDDANIDPTSDLLLTLDPASVYFDPSEPAAYHVPSGLATFGVHSATVRLAVPTGDPFATDNEYYVGMIVDADGNAPESNETNNRNLGLGVDQQAVTYAPAFFNTASVNIPTSGSGNPYPSNVVISGVVGAVADVNVSLFGITHTNPDDLDILLVGPAGQTIILLSDVGGTPDIIGINLVLDSEASSSLPDATVLISGTYRPTNIGSSDSFLSPAPAGPYGSTLSELQGTNPNGTWSLYVMDDAGSNSGSITGGWGLTFTLANAAPSNPASVPLAPIDEDIAAAANAGSLVSSIVAATGSSDVEGDPLGIAVTSIDDTHGQWQYSDNAGGSWQDFLAVSLASARLLAPPYLVRFVPDVDFNSAFAASPTLGFKVWDQTFGTAGGTADTTTGSAFSAATAVASQPVTAANDAPSFTLAIPLVMADEDAGNTSVAGFVTDFAPGPATAIDEAGQTLVFVVTVIGTTGTLAFDVEPSIDPLSGELSFASAADAYGTATIDMLLRDSGSGTLPNVNESSTQQFTIEISPINDEQLVVVNLGLTAERGSNTAITSEALETADVDNLPAELLYTVTVAPSHGAILVDGTPALQFTQEQIDAGMVTYQNDGTASLSDSFDFEVDDGQGAASSGTFNILVQPYPGDYNRDFIVDAADFTLWRRTQGTTGLAPYSGADGNGDGTIDQDDYDIWRAHFGESWPAAAAHAASAASISDGPPTTESGALAGEAATAAIEPLPPALVGPDAPFAKPQGHAESFVSPLAAPRLAVSDVRPAVAAAGRARHSARSVGLQAKIAATITSDVALMAWLNTRAVNRHSASYESRDPVSFSERDAVDDDQLLLDGMIDAAFGSDESW